MLILSVRLSKHILHMHELPGPKSGGEGINRHPLPLFAEARVIGVGATPMGAILLPRPSPTGAKPSTSQILTRSFGSSCSVPSRPHIQCLFEQQTKHAIRLRVSLKWRQHPSTRQQLTCGLSVSQHAPEPHVHVQPIKLSRGDKTEAGGLFWHIGFGCLWVGFARCHKSSSLLILAGGILWQARPVVASPLNADAIPWFPQDMCQLRPPLTRVPSNTQRNPVRKRTLLRKQRQSMSQVQQPDPAKPQPKAARNRPGPRLQVYTYNAGGLNYHSFMAWSESSDVAYDIIVVTETRRAFDSEWSTASYHCIHTHASYAGVLVMVRKTLVPQQGLSCCCHVAGRLLQVQLSLAEPLHIIAVYQHAWSAENVSDTLVKRASVWKAILKVLMACPPKHQVLLLGDFNTDLARSSGRVATELPAGRSRETIRQDSGELAAILERHDLIALNGQIRWTPTFCGAQGLSREVATRIDFIFMRRRHVDDQSRRPLIIRRSAHDLHRGNVPHHRPIVASVPCRRAPHKPTLGPDRDFTASQRAALRQAIQHPGSEALAAQQQMILSVRSSPSLDEALQALAAGARSMCSSQRVVSTTLPKLERDFEWKSYAQAMWRSYRLMKGARGPLLKRMLLVWKHRSRFLAMSRQSRQVARARRKAVLATFLAQTHEAFLRDDAHVWYKSINHLCPKGAQRPIHLRDAKGDLLSPADSHQALLKYYRNLYHDPGFTPPSFKPLSQLPFTVQELEQGFARLPLTKALRPDVAPAGAWRVASESMAEQVYRQCQLSMCSEPCHIPQDWDKSRLCLLTKPQKSPSTPAALRPIALQHPITKVVTGILVTKVQEAKPDVHRPWPLYAYLPQRGTSDCLLTIFQHIREVRSSVQQHSKRTGRQSRAKDLEGGLMVTLDLEKAFDSVSREHVSDSIRMLGLEPGLEQLMLMFLAEGSYEIVHKGHYGVISGSKGIKQGSKESPYEWCLTSILLLGQLVKMKGLRWVQDHIVVYADDFILRWKLHSVTDLHRALQEAAAFISTLEASGLQVSTDKSAALLEITGGGSYQVQQRFVRMRQSKRHLVCKGPQYEPMNSSPNPEHPFCDSRVYWLPLVQRFNYLGTTIGYKQPEKDTLDRRVAAAKHAFSKLRPVLHAYRTHSLRARLKLYFATVWPTVTYGILEAGIQQQGARKIHGMVMRHLRGISRSPVHITRESNQALLSRLKIPAPLDKLCALWRSKAQAWSTRQSNLPADDICKQVPQYPDPTAALTGAQQNESANVALATEPVLLRCEQCQEEFHSLPELKRHRRHAHEQGPRTFQADLFVPTRDAVPGTWNCAHCGDIMQDRRSLRSHICFQACSRFDPNKQGTPGGILYQDNIKQLKLNGKLMDLLKDPVRCKSLTQQCVVCATQIPYPNRVRQHISKYHPELYPKADSRAEQLHASFKGRNQAQKCSHCQAFLHRGLSGHRYPVLLQLAVLLTAPDTASSAEAQNGLDQIPSAPAQGQLMSDHHPPSPPLVVSIKAGSSPAETVEAPLPGNRMLQADQHARDAHLHMDRPLPAPLQALMADDRRRDPEPPPKARKLAPSRKKTQLPNSAHELDTPGYRQPTLKLSMFAVSSSQAPEPGPLLTLESFSYDRERGRGGPVTRQPDGDHGRPTPQQQADERKPRGRQAGEDSETRKGQRIWQTEEGQGGDQSGGQSAQHGCATLDCPRGHPAGAAAGIGVYGLHAGQWQRESGPDYAGPVTEVACRDSDRGGSQGPTANAYAGCGLQGVGNAVDQAHGGESRGSRNSPTVECPESLDRGWEGVVLHEVGPGAGKTPADEGNPIADERRLSSTRSSVCLGPDSRPDPSLLCFESAKQSGHGESFIGIRDRSLEADSFHAEPSSGGTVPSPDPAEPQCYHAGDSDTAQAGNLAAIPGCTSHCETSLQGESLMTQECADESAEWIACDEGLKLRVLEWRWDNPGWNLCYANASLTAMTWCCCFTTWNGGLTPDASAWLRQVAQNTSASHVNNLLQCIPYCKSARDWWHAHPIGVQQDAAEFTTVFLAAMCGMTSGVAERRQMQQSRDVCDVHRMLLLSVPSRHEHWSLQDILEDWHVQHGPLQALTAPVQHLCLRLDCCDIRGNKRMQQIIIDAPQVLLPCFTAEPAVSQSVMPPDQNVLWNVYTVRSVVQHHGPTYKAGHYTAIVLQEFPQALHFDDAQVPRHIPDIRQVTHDHYLVWLSLDSATASGRTIQQSAPVAHAAREAAATGSVVGMPLTEFGCVQPSMPNSPTSVFEPQPLRYSPRAVQQSAPVAHAAREAAAIVGDVGVSLTEFGCVQPSVTHGPPSALAPQPLGYSVRAVQQSAPVAHAAYQAAATAATGGVVGLSLTKLGCVQPPVPNHPQLAFAPQPLQGYDASARARAHHGPTIASSEGESGIEESSEAVIDESTSFVIGSLFG